MNKTFGLVQKKDLHHISLGRVIHNFVLGIDFRPLNYKVVLTDYGSITVFSKSEWFLIMLVHI